METSVEKQLSEATVKSYKRDYKNHIKWLKDNNVKAVKSGAHVVQYLKALEGGYPNNKPKAGKTLRRYFNAIRHGYTEAKKPVDFDAAKAHIKAACKPKPVE